MSSVDHLIEKYSKKESSDSDDQSRETMVGMDYNFCHLYIIWLKSTTIQERELRLMTIEGKLLVFFSRNITIKYLEMFSTDLVGKIAYQKFRCLKLNRRKK